MGGPNIFIDNVCGNCNRKFSDYERALMRDSPVAFIRSIEGVDGYHRGSDLPPGAFLAPILLTFDEEKKVVYEVGQRYPFENFIRPQFISIHGAFYVEGYTRDSLQNLDRKFTNWKREVRFIVIKTWLNGTASIQWIEFVDTGERIELFSKSLEGISLSTKELKELADLTGPEKNDNLGYSFSDIRLRVLPEAIAKCFPIKELTFSILKETISQVKPSPKII